MIMLFAALAMAPAFGQTHVDNGPNTTKNVTAESKNAGNKKNQSPTVGITRFVQVSDADAGKDLELQIQNQGLVALVQAAQKAAASGLSSNKLDTSLPNILQSELNPLPYIRGAEVGKSPIAPMLFEQGRDGSFYDPSTLAGVMNDQFLIAGFYSIAKEHISVWVLGFSATAGKTGKAGSRQEGQQENYAEQASGILPSFSFSGTFELTSLERYPEMFLAEVLSWIAGEPLRVVDVVAESAAFVPELLLEPEDNAVAYARRARLFVKAGATMLHPVKVSAKGYLPFNLDAREALKNGASYARVSPTLQKDPSFSNLADSFQPSALDWPDKKAYSSSLGQFRTYLGYTAIGVPISLLCTGWFVQQYEATSRRASNSAWLYVSGGLAAVSLGATVTFLVNAGINFLASTKTSQSGGK